MQRRFALAVGVLAVLAVLGGCSAAGSIEMRPVNGTELAAAASRAPATGPPERVESDRSRAAVVRAAATNGSTTVTGLQPPVSEGLPFRVDGAYYDLQWSVVDSREANMVGISIDYDGSAPNATAIAYEDLPAPDRAALDALLPPRHPPETGSFEIGVGSVYTDGELNVSVLAPTQQYGVVVFEGERYPIRVEEPRAVEVKTYRYDAARVAPNASAYAAHLRSTYAFTLANLSDAERSVVEEAAGGSYYADSTDDAAFAAVLERFRARRAVVSGDASGTWLVRYDGQLYLADLRYGAFVA
ncbi:MAG: hypothetical protein ABEJ68_05420 [Halobacteriaceae archaeon]